MNFSFLRYIIFSFSVLATSITFVYAYTNNVTDQQALFSVKASVTLDSMGVLDSWNNSVHFCRWKGVTCSHRQQRVTELNLSSHHLVGTLSPHIGNLSFLRVIHLSENDFHGSIPNEIGRLSRLQYLYLVNNSFEGKFPANLSHCVDIRNISMFNNNLEGNLPNEFASWSKLYKFDLGRNHFAGSIPPSIGNISSLRLLHLGNNNLSGGIPLEISHLKKLKILVLSENNLGGMVPPHLYNISSLYDFILYENELEGELPTNLGFTLPKLQEFYIGENRFSGEFPPSITNLSSVVTFSIYDNDITGPVPMNLGSLPNIKWLDLGGNPFGDNELPDDLNFFNSLVNCTHLYALNLNENGLKGQLPNSIVNLSTSIEILHLYGNYIYGNIPREIGKLVRITQLGLHRNNFTGTIPESIGELSNLGALDLSTNNISGVIPTSISNMTRLSILSLEYNMLHGSIPIGLFNISTLQVLSLFSNRLNGVIPEQIAGLSSQCVFLYLHHNLFTGALPANIGSLKQLVHLNVSNNKLTGDVPASLGDCVMLEMLNMEGNLFQGRIPTSFRELKSLVILDLSDNNISETIPSFFIGFHLLAFLNLSHNNLRGEVPIKGLFSNVSQFSVDGNLQLCGGIQALQLPACPVKISKTKKKTFFKRIILILVLLPVFILFACLALIFYRHQKSKQKKVPVPVSGDNVYPRVSYQDLSLATNEFSLNNLLGKGRHGSVYEGTLESLEQTVAVKVLNVEVRGANKSFLAECETLRNIRHRNLLKIITACSSTDFKGNDFKALVFEFMTNGSLDNWLHPSPSCQRNERKGNERNLTLLQRLNISIDVAQGVDYLHHHSHTCIIHCDIKPSNILLDEEFVAHIGDFGLARFSFATATDIKQAQTSSIGVRGTVGYIPPEYGMGAEISEEGDVYSYGILLLEMFSGERPTGSSILEDNGNNLHDYVKKALPHSVMHIADSRIILDHGLTSNQSYSRETIEVCLASIFEVGILCSVATPRERIGMGDAIKQLHVARDKLLRCWQ